jgi:hypothetical protein
MGLGYNTGGLNSATNHNFVSYYDAHEPDIQDELVQRYMSTMIGFLDFVDAKKPCTAAEFSRFEKDRTMPKIKATTAGAGAGAQATFTVDADSKISIPSVAPYDTGATPAGLTMPIRLNDLIMIKPASGIVSSGNYIKAIVDSVTNNTQFKATPIKSGDSVPAINAADEIIIYGNAHGEGSVFNAPMSTTATKFTEKLQITKHRIRVTGTEGLTKKWYKDSTDNMKFQVQGESDGYSTFLNLMDMNLLVGEELANTTVASTFQAAGTPLAMTRGVLHAILDAGNVLNYSSISGLLIADMYDFNIVIDANKAQKKNLWMVGIALDQQMDVELGDRFKNGAITYGNFGMDQDKAVNLSFQKARIGVYEYDKRCMEAFNDLQTLGADGYGYKYEGFTIPAGATKIPGGDEKGQKAASLRKRYLAKEGKSREMNTYYFNGVTDADNGDDFEEVRYMSECALESQALNQFGYMKRV